MKRILSALLSLALLLSCIAGMKIPVNAAENITNVPEDPEPVSKQVTKSLPSGLKYGINKNGEVTITDYTGSATELVIPDTIDSYPVTSIGYSAFISCTSLTSVTIPDSVTSIGDYAFNGCSNLNSITIPDSVTSIGQRAFAVCTNLTSVTIGNSVATISYYAFYGCTSLTSITIPDTITRIGSHAFSNCSSLTSVTIPDSVTSIGDFAFDNCTNLANITIHDSVTSIGNGAFYRCSNLQYNVYDNAKYLGNSENPYVVLAECIDKTITDCLIHVKTKIIYSEVFESCGLTSITIPNSVTSIGDGAFMSCGSLTSVTIGNSVISIGDSTFSYCRSLTNITIPDSVASIGDSAFYNCTGLNSVIIGNGVTSIGSEAFAECRSLTSVTIGDGGASIGSGAFYNCRSLISVTIPDSVTNIDSSAFSGCSNLTGITIPDSVTSIGDGAFKNCSSLTNVAIGSGVTSIGSEAFGKCSSLTSITIGDGITSIGDYAFDGCSSLADVYISDIAGWCDIQFETYSSNPVNYSGNLYLNGELIRELVIPDGVTSIGQYAFFGYSCLTSITIPDSVTGIGDYAFSDCTGLTSIIIPDSVTRIGDFAFSGCSSLEIIYYIGTEEQWDTIAIGSYYIPVNNVNIVYHMEKPEAPTVLQKDSRYVTLTPLNGGEYSIDGVNWRAENMFTGLTPNTQYAFYQRIAKTDTLPAGAISEPLYVTLPKDAPSPPKNPVLVEYTATTVVLIPLENYEYSKDGITWQKSNVFIGLLPETKYTFYQRIAETDTVFASEISEPLYVVTLAKELCTTLPQKPVLAEYTVNSITLQFLEGYEYSKDGINWQSSNVFTGLSPETKYTFYQRIAETDMTLASSVSEPLSARTYAKFACSIAPVKPVVQDYTGTTVKLVAKSGYEYSKDGKNWQSSNTFSGLLPNTQYTFYQRIKETTTERASAASEGVSIKTLKTGLSTASNYDALVSYINKYGVTSSGNKTVSFADTGTDGNYYFHLENRSDGVYCYVEHTTNNSSVLMYYATGILLKRCDKSVETNMKMNLYSYSYGVSQTFTPSAVIDRSKHTTTSVIQLTDAEVGSVISDMYHSSLNYLLAGLSLYFYDNLGFSIGGLGFFAFEKEVTGNTSYQKNYCDPATGHHLGSSELHNKRPVSCTCDGYTGDYHCSVCGEKTRSGSTIQCTGSHGYDNVCDKDCNTCGEERRVTHTYSGYCDKTCEICAAGRTTLLNHIDENSDQYCDVCGSKNVSGDIDGNGKINRDDVIQLLLHVSMPAAFPIDGNADFTGDGKITRDDVVQLLLHISMPDVFPLG